MADLSQTPANVRATSTTQITRVTAGATVVPGQPVYRATDGNYELADASASASANCEGIAINYANNGDDLFIAIGGDIDLGATLTVGAIYVVSDTEGSIMPSSDLSTGEYSTILGVAETASNLKIKITVSGAQVP